MTAEVKSKDVQAPPELKPRQKRFCELYVTEPNGAKAAKDAGYSKTGASVTATRLLKLPHVQVYIDALRQEAASRMQISIDSIIKNLRDAYDKAMEDGKYSDAVRAMELIGKHLGMFTERVQKSLTIAQGATSEAEMGEQISRLMNILGPDAAKLQSNLSKSVN